MSTVTYLNWNSEEVIIWGFNDFLWNEVFVVSEIAGAFPEGISLQRKITWDHLEKELDKKNISDKDKKVFLKVIAKVNGLVSSDVKKIDPSIKRSITVDHVRNTFKSFGHKIEVKVKKVKKE